MSWFSGRFRCSSEECLHIFDELVEREKKDDPIPCPLCEGEASRIPFANPMRASYPDTVKRFQDQKEMRALDKAAHQARKAGDTETVKKVTEEKNFFKINK